MSTTETGESGKRFHRVTADIAPETAQALKVYCAQNGIRLKAAVSLAITQFVNSGKSANKGKK